MKETNKINEQLKKKAKDELHGLIEEFIDKLKPYEHTSHTKAEFPTHSDMSGSAEMCFGSGYPYVLIHRALIRMVEAPYLDKLTDKKTEELLTKLELI